MSNQLTRWMTCVCAVVTLLLCFAAEAQAQTSCPGPYHVVAPDGRCVWSCSQGTTPDNQSGECVCQAGLVETGKDQFGRRVCEEPKCPGPYHVVAPDGRCVWSCSQGTTPDNQSGECVCQAGLVETGKDQFGRRICEPKGPESKECKGPYHVLAKDGRCVWSCAEGTTPDEQSGECGCQLGLVETGKDQFGRRTCAKKRPETPQCKGPYHVLAKDGRCVWSCSVGTTPDKKTGQCVCQAGLVETGADEFGRRVCQKQNKAENPRCKGPYKVVAKDGRCVWSCGEGTTPAPERGVCVCKEGHKPARQPDKFGRTVCLPAKEGARPKPNPPRRQPASPQTPPVKAPAAGAR